MPSSLTFDTLEYSKILKAAGFTEKQAEAQAHALAEVVDNNLATKNDIELLRKDLIIEIERSKSEIIKWNVGAVFASVGLFATIMKLLG